MWVGKDERQAGFMNAQKQKMLARSERLGLPREQGPG